MQDTHLLEEDSYLFAAQCICHHKEEILLALRRCNLKSSISWL